MSDVCSVVGANLVRNLVFLVLGVLLCAGSAEAASSKRPIHRVESADVVTLLSYNGSIDEDNFDKFTQIISSNTDKVIELKLVIERSRKDQGRYDVSVGDSQLTISGGDPMSSPREVLISGSIGTTFDMLTVDGFYLVKSGGVHAAGALSWGLLPVDEATIRLNPKIRIVKRAL